MTGLYWFAFVVGGGMFLFSLFGDAEHGHDHDGDLGHHDVQGFKILSLRNATYFLFAFGVSGVLLTWMWGGGRGLLTALVASMLGVIGGAISALTFGWLRKSESGELLTDANWIGATGQVTIPLSTDGTGKVLVSRGHRELELLARPFDSDARDPDRWTTVMVVEMKQGVALVAPSDTALDDPETPRLGATTEN
jgi:hypothetical protein